MARPCVCITCVTGGRRQTDGRTERLCVSSHRFGFLPRRGPPVTFSSVYDYSRGQTEKIHHEKWKNKCLTFLQTSLSRPVSATAGRRLGDTVKAAQRHSLDQKKKHNNNKRAVFAQCSAKLACQGRKRSAFAQPSRNAGDGLNAHAGRRPSPQTPPTERVPYYSQ